METLLSTDRLAADDVWDGKRGVLVQHEHVEAPDGAGRGRERVPRGDRVQHERRVRADVVGRRGCIQSETLFALR